MAKFSVTDKVHHDYVVLHVNGYINNLGGEKIDERCSHYLKKGIKNFVINFQDTELINSVGISILIGVIEKVLQVKGVLYFTNANKVSKEIFHMLELSKFAKIFDTEEQAVAHLLKNL
jgi:anti-anti-sigma factor